MPKLLQFYGISNIKNGGEIKMTLYITGLIVGTGLALMIFAIATLIYLELKGV